MSGILSETVEPSDLKVSKKNIHRRNDMNFVTLFIVKMIDES
jgi:hypothetical protein